MLGKEIGERQGIWQPARAATHALDPVKQAKHHVKEGRGWQLANEVLQRGGTRAGRLSVKDDT